MHHALNKMTKKDCPSLLSRFLSRLRRSASSGAVIRLLLRFWTMMLANSTSSSFARQSAIVRYMRSALSVMQSCLMMRLPRVSRSRRSVQNSFRRLTMKEVKYVSSLCRDICDRSSRSRVTTASEGSERVLSRAGKVPSSTVSICRVSVMTLFPKSLYLLCQVPSCAALSAMLWPQREWPRVHLETAGSEH